MGELSVETKTFLMERDIIDLKEHQQEQDRLIAMLKDERDRALVWGILALGGLVVTLIAFLVSLFKDHIK